MGKIWEGHRNLIVRYSFFPYIMSGNSDIYLFQFR